MNTSTAPPDERTADPSAPPRRPGPNPARSEPSGIRPGGIRLGRWFGIEIRLEGSWFVILALLIVSFSGNLAVEHPTLSPDLRWIIAVGTSLLFFGSIVLHELAHSVMARRLGLQVHGITLMLFGGVSQLASEPKRPKDDLAIAIVGPLTSAAIGAAFLALAQFLSPIPLAKTIAGWLGTINLGLAVFNLLPGFPLDGGRVLKALIWAVTRDADRAYALAIAAGKVVAYGMILGGVIMAFGLNWTVDGLWIGFMGWYLLSGAQSSRLQRTLSEALRQHLVRDVLRPPEAVVRPDEALSDAVDAWVLRRGHRTLLVCEGTRLLGLVTMHQIKQVPQEDWDRRLVGQIMIPAALLAIAAPDQNLLQAFRNMEERQVSQLPVVLDGRLVGILGREDILRVLTIETEMNRHLSSRAPL
jgi:Zn-dependent protease/predicted transcriptional regulator